MSTQCVNINGKSIEFKSNNSQTLLNFLRDHLHFTGTKYGCGEAECGACVVLVNGEPKPSCQLSVKSLVDSSIITIEGIAKEGKLHPVQQAFLELDALQCGYCTPGMIVAAVALLRENLNPSDNEIRQALNKHICRCGAYQRIVAAIQLAASRIREHNTDCCETLISEQ